MTLPESSARPERPRRPGPVPRGPIVLLEIPINRVTDRFGLSAIAMYPPLAQVRLAAQLPGEDVRLFDLRLRGEARRLAALLRAEPPQLVGISCTFSSNGDEAIRVADAVRKASPDTLIVLGGTAASEDPAAFLRSAVDLIAVRRADGSLPALARALREDRTPPEEPAGFLRRAGDRWQAGPAFPSPALGSLRPYAWHLLPPGAARRYYQGFRVTGMGQSSEGCPYDCSFCSVWKVHGRRVDVASLDNLKHDLSALHGSATNFFFADDIWMLASEAQKQEVYDPLLEWMASTYVPRRPSVEITIETRTDLFLREDARFRDWIRRGSLRKIFFGIEAVTDEQLEAFSKRVTVDRNSDAIRLAAELGVYVVAQFVIPCDATGAYFDEIVRFLDAHRGLIGAANFTIATPLPGTDLYQQMLPSHPELADRSIVRPPAFALYTALMPTLLPAPEFYAQVARVYRAATQVKVNGRGARTIARMSFMTPWLIPRVLRMPFVLKRLHDPQTFLEVHRQVQGGRLLDATTADAAAAALAAAGGVSAA